MVGGYQSMVAITVSRHIDRSLTELEAGFGRDQPANPAMYASKQPLITPLMQCAQCKAASCSVLAPCARSSESIVAGTSRSTVTLLGGGVPRQK